MTRQPKLYRINLVRTLREEERRAEQKQRLQISVISACLIGLVLGMLYAGFTFLNIERVLKAENLKLEQVRGEYRKYTATRTIVDKSDVELLSQLQDRGIFWTKQLAALATHLPDNYSITGFSYNQGELKVSGSGLASSRQDQLLTLDAYLNHLRKDPAFSAVFQEVYLNNTNRTGEAGTGKIAFEFSAISAKGSVKK